ncbi:acylphosphatase [Pseudoduganella sp. OTU4001]|uniref:acylphosphatase n=1 Tax=Pseudoduganella sp. OTU4001 TaxID=3043854 RepID=UPI00313E0486
MAGSRLLIEGLVQGVGYRYAFSERAAALGLAGWVRNRANGAVEASVHGPEAAVQAIIEWAHQGPRAARVSRVTVVGEDEPPPAAQQFEIRPTA